MIRRAAMVLAVLIVSVGTSAVIAQSGPVAARMALMEGNNNHARTMVQMMRGQMPYDPVKVDAAFAQWAETAQKLPALFPDNSKTGESKTGEKTRATPKVWETRSDFLAKVSDFGKSVADNRAKAMASLDGLKAAIPAVGKTCDNCHEDYRVPQR